MRSPLEKKNELKKKCELEFTKQKNAIPKQINATYKT